MCKTKAQWTTEHSKWFKEEYSKNFSFNFFLTICVDTIQVYRGRITQDLKYIKKQGNILRKIGKVTTFFSIDIEWLEKNSIHGNPIFTKHFFQHYISGQEDSEVFCISGYSCKFKVNVPNWVWSFYKTFAIYNKGFK